MSWKVGTTQSGSHSTHRTSAASNPRRERKTEREWENGYAGEGAVGENDRFNHWHAYFPQLQLRSSQSNKCIKLCQV